MIENQIKQIPFDEQAQISEGESSAAVDWGGVYTVNKESGIWVSRDAEMYLDCSVISSAGEKSQRHKKPIWCWVVPEKGCFTVVFAGDSDPKAGFADSFGMTN